MNWVGGIRNRVKLKQEKKLQKEFFERKRLEKKLKIPNSTSVNTSSSKANGQTSISQDLLALQVIMKTHDKPVNKRKHEIRQPTRIDLSRPSQFHSKKYKQEEMIDLPLPSSLKPSELDFAGAMDSVKTVKPQTFSVNHDSRKKREVRSSFEFNNSENINRFRKHSFYPEIKNRSHSLHNFSRGSISQKNNGMVFEKRLNKQTYQVDQQSPFIPFAAPAPHSLAARSISSLTSQYSRNEFSSPGNDHSPVFTSTPLKTWTQKHDNESAMDINNDRFTDNCTTNTKAEFKDEILFYQKSIHGKDEHDNVIKNCQNFPIQSPAQNEVTIDCLNRSDPQSFLTDLQLLDELMTESRQHSLTNPSDIPQQHGDTNPPPEQPYSEHDDKQLDCKDAVLIHTQYEPRINEKCSADEAWRNFVMNANQNVCNKPPKLCEEKEATLQEEKLPENPSFNTTDNAQSNSRSKAAEELKEVMAVKQYESSQESSCDSSWSSMCSDDYSRTLGTTTTSKKSPIKKEEETTTSETKMSSSSQELPSSSTSEQLANSQSNVYTLGFSHGLQKRPKELALRSQDHERSDLSVFRIYPLSRSQDKGTQTDPNTTEAPALVYHKSVQCQIQENRINGKSSEISGHKQSKSTSSTVNTLTTSGSKASMITTDQDNKMKPGEPFVITSNETGRAKYQAQFNMSEISKKPVFHTFTKTPTDRSLTTTKCNEPVPITNRLMDATFKYSCPVNSVNYSSVTTPRTSDQPCSIDTFPVSIPEHSSVTTPRISNQPCSTDTFPLSIPEHSSVTTAKTSNQPCSVTTPRTNDQPCSTDTFPVSIPEHSSVTTAKTSDQPCSVTTAKTSDQPCSVTTAKTCDQPCSTDTIPVTRPTNLPCGTSHHHPTEASQNITDTTCKDYDDYSSNETSPVITVSREPMNSISSSDTTPKSFQATTSATFPLTKHDELSASTPRGLKEAVLYHPPSSHQVIKPIDHGETAAKVQVSSDFKLKDKENHYQNIIKKLDKDIEQLQNINIYQSIVIKFLQM